MCKKLSKTAESSMELESVPLVPSTTLTFAVLVFLTPGRVLFFEGSAAAPVQTYTAIWSGSKFSVVFLSLVMQDAMSAVSDVWP